MLTYYDAQVKVILERTTQIEQITKLQGMGDGLAANLWIAERKKQITSSAAGKIAKRRASTKVCNMVKSLLYHQFRGTAATEWGREREPVIRERYIQYMLQQKSTQLTVQPSGLVIHPVHAWLAVSPDGLVCDPAAQDQLHVGLVEYKNPYSHRDASLQTAAQTNFFGLKTNQEGTLFETHTQVFLPDPICYVLHWKELA